MTEVFFRNDSHDDAAEMKTFIMQETTIKIIFTVKEKGENEAIRAGHRDWDNYLHQRSSHHKSTYLFARGGSGNKKEV